MNRQYEILMKLNQLANGDVRLVQEAIDDSWKRHEPEPPDLIEVIEYIKIIKTMKKL